MKERRDFVRVLSDLSVRYQVDETQPVQQVKTCDVGGGGIRFLSDEKITDGILLNLEIDVPGARHAVTASVRVIWCKKLSETSWEVATAFAEIDPRDRDKVMRHVFYARKQS